MTILEPQTGQNHQHDQAAPARATGPHENNAQAGREVRGQSPVTEGWKAAVLLFSCHHGCERLAPGSLPFIAAVVAALLMAVGLAPRRAMGEKTVR